jgi:hypothetical protein
VNAVPKSLGASLGVMISLGTRHINMIEYSSESSDDEEADMCVAEWSWGQNLNHSCALA